jgi:hypothetical protein
MDINRTDKEGEEELAIVKAMTLKLRERFDTVQIIVSRHEGSKGTINLVWGSGNIFARIKQAEIWAGSQSEEILYTRLKDNEENKDNEV